MLPALAQQGAQQKDTPALRPGRRQAPFDRRRNVGAMVAHPGAFKDVIMGMSQAQDADAGGPRGFAQQGVPRVPCRGGQSARRLWSDPVQGRKGGADATGVIGNRLRPAGAIGIQTMIDTEDVQRPAAPLRQPV